ncbi:protein spinster-like [Sycon ciliatum]|uniref:protein spinster-like n=1 Tax=Sycon ciliatum TaxID=27933 RepID=UPI0031F6E147
MKEDVPALGGDRRSGETSPSSSSSSVPLRSLASLIVLFLVSILNQADRWVFPALAPAGLRCYVPPPDSCNTTTTPSPKVLPTASFMNEIESKTTSSYQLSYSGAEGSMSSSFLATGNTSESNSTANGTCASEGCIDFDSYDQGILTGPAFAAIYVLSGIPLSRLADTSSRLLVLSLGLCLWSGTVFATGFVQTRWQLYLTRLSLGIGEATCSPVAYSLLAELFSPKHHALVISIYSAGTYVGASIGNLCGFVSNVLCWRWTFRILGLTGFSMFPIMFATLYKKQPQAPSVRVTINGSSNVNDDSQSSVQAKGRRYTVKETFFELAGSWPYMIITVAASVRFIGGYALGAWCATFYREHYGEPPRSYGMKLFIVFMAGGLPGSILGGFIADKTMKYGLHWKAYVIALTQAIAAPLAAAIFLMPTAMISYVMLTVSFLFSEAWMGVAASIVQDVHKPAVRCQASAVYIAIGTLVGCAGPVLVSAILSNQEDCNKSYKLALLYIVPTTYLASALLFLLTGVVRHCQRTNLSSTPPLDQVSPPQAAIPDDLVSEAHLSDQTSRPASRKTKHSATDGPEVEQQWLLGSEDEDDAP